MLRVEVVQKLADKHALQHVQPLVQEIVRLRVELIVFIPVKGLVMECHIVPLVQDVPTMVATCFVLTRVMQSAMVVAMLVAQMQVVNTNF